MSETASGPIPNQVTRMHGSEVARVFAFRPEERGWALAPIAWLGPSAVLVRPTDCHSASSRDALGSQQVWSAASSPAR